MGDKFVGWAALTQLVTEIKTRIAGRIASSEKGASNGVATLDATGRVPYTQLPESAMEFKGGWDASTNTPELKDGTGINGDFYVCNVAGTVNFGTTGSPRSITFYVNDRALYDGTSHQWIRLPASEVRSVNGASGDVVLQFQAASGSDIATVGTPSVEASTSGTVTTLTFHKLKGATGATGPQGPQGPTGATGATGPQGPQGPAGSNGTNGSNGTSAAWFTGTAVTGTGSSISVTVSGSKKGDMYLNTSTSNVYSATAANTWKYVCNIKGATGARGPQGETGATGPQGPSGANGTNGTNGTSAAWFTGTAVTGTGSSISVTVSGSKAGDMYLNTSTNYIYSATAANTWKYVSVITSTNAAKLESKTWRETAHAGLYVTTDTRSLSVTLYTFTLTAPAGSIDLAAGSVVRITFRYALQSSSYIGAVYLTYGGRTGTIKVAMNNSLLNIGAHKFTGGSYSSSYPYKVWDDYTTLELMWTGSEWLIMGNPTFCYYVSTAAGYTVYANGLIEQWYKTSSISSKNSETVTFSVQFRSGLTPNSTFGSLYDSSADSTTVVQLRTISNTQAQIKNATSSTVTNAFAFFRGY